MLVVPILKLPRSHAYIEGFGVFDCCFVNHGGYTAVAIQRAFVSINTVAFLCVSCRAGRFGYFFIMRGHNVFNIRAAAIGDFGIFSVDNRMKGVVLGKVLVN